MDSIKNSKTKTITRRYFIKDSVAAAGAIALGGGIFSTISGCSDSSPTQSQNGGLQPVDLVLDLNDAAYQSLRAVGGSLALNNNTIDSAGLLLYRESNTQISAYTRRCTHQGCTIGPFINGRSTCPCHGSVFNTTGAPVNGPAASALPRYTTKLENEILTISR